MIDYITVPLRPFIGFVDDEDMWLGYIAYCKAQYMNYLVPDEVDLIGCLGNITTFRWQLLRQFQQFC